MMMKVMTSSFLLLFVLSAQAGMLKKVDQCAKVKSDKTIYLIKQWHLPPQQDTTKIEVAEKLPQFKNQAEIYAEIASLVDKKSIDAAVAEGCEGEIDSKFKSAFNGWTFESLSKEVASKKYSSILTHVLLKSEVKFGDQLKTLCGDDLSEVKKAQLALSDLRGDVGYWQRIAENEKNAAKQKIYLDGVIETFKLPSSTDAPNALLALKKDIVDSLKKFQDANAERNAAAVRALKKVDSKKPILMVFGGLHAANLKERFQEEKWNCEIFEPKSYENNEEKLLNDFKKITR